MATQEILVHKYGGSSVGSPERIQNVASRIQTLRKTHDRIVVVVSAMGDTTDELVRLAFQLSKSPNPREYDALISTGENVSAALLAMALIEKGCDACSLTGAQAGIVTENIYSKAKIVNVKPERILRELSLGKVVVVTGFQGINPAEDIVTIGRGGSDTSAVVLAAALGSSECYICTDVDGVYTTDPRIEPKAQKLAHVSYDEMLELASLGAKVLHPRAVEVAKENKIDLIVCSSFSWTPGTRLKEINNMEISRPVTGVAVDEDQVKLAITKIPDRPGVAGQLFSRLAEGHLNVDMIVQSIQEGQMNTITFTVNKSDVETAKFLSEQVAKDLGGQEVVFEDHVAKLSIVGVGMISKPGIASQMFSALGDNGINIKLITSSEIKISCLIDQKDAKKAVQVLHASFGLDQVTN